MKYRFEVSAGDFSQYNSLLFPDSSRNLKTEFFSFGDDSILQPYIEVRTALERVIKVIANFLLEFIEFISFVRFR